MDIVKTSIYVGGILLVLFVFLVMLIPYVTKRKNVIVMERCIM